MNDSQYPSSGDDDEMVSYSPPRHLDHRKHDGVASIVSSVPPPMHAQVPIVESPPAPNFRAAPDPCESRTSSLGNFHRGENHEADEDTDSNDDMRPEEDKEDELLASQRRIRFLRSNLEQVDQLMKEKKSGHGRNMVAVI